MPRSHLAFEFQQFLAAVGRLIRSWWTVDRIRVSPSRRSDPMPPEKPPPVSHEGSEVHRRKRPDGSMTDGYRSR